MYSRKIFNVLLIPTRTIYNTSKIGNRDWVGYGINGCANYMDDPKYPFPAVRFKENTRDICALRQKEIGDWRMLCCEEKKALYRASFCQTFAEMQYPTGDWKFCMGWALFCVGCAFWIAMFVREYVVDPPGVSFTQEYREAMLRRMLDLHVNPVDGLSSKWDYDNDCWK